MKKDKKKQAAVELLNSPRGMYLLAQALYEAIKALRKVPAPMTPHNNINEMELILNTLFPSHKALLEGIHGEIK